MKFTKKKYRIGLDLCSFNKVHCGGKDQVIYNLIKGFGMLHRDDDIVCFLHRELVDTIRAYNKNIKLFIVPHIKLPQRLNFFSIAFDGFYENYFARKMWVELLVFSNKNTPYLKFSMKTAVIPHDIQAFEYNSIPGLGYTIKSAKKTQQIILRDFKLRDYIIAISDYDKTEMVKYMPQFRNKIFRLYDPVDFGNIVENAICDKKYITVLNIQWKHKNIETIIRAFNEIVNDINLDLVLIGKLPEDINKYYKYIEENKLKDRVIFTGFVHQKKLEKIIDKTRIYVNASLYEGFGMTAIEMMGKGIPTIVSKSTAMPEVTLGLCNYYEPADNYYDLADAIMREIESPKSENDLLKIAEIVRKKYSYYSIAEEYLEVFEKWIQK